MFGVNSDNFILRLSVYWKKLSKISGSRYNDGNVPNMNWNSINDKLNVSYYNIDNANDNLRAREKFPRLKRNPIYWDFFNKYLIQPFVILDISCRLDSIII